MRRAIAGPRLQLARPDRVRLCRQSQWSQWLPAARRLLDTTGASTGAWLHRFGGMVA